MRKVKDNGSPHYKYIVVYVDDLLIVSKISKAIVDLLTNKYKFKLKGTGSIKYHLGCDFAQDELSTLYFVPRKYIEKIGEAYFSYFSSKPNTVYTSPLELGDHLKLDVTPLLDQDDTQQYQSMIEAL